MYEAFQQRQRLLQRQKLQFLEVNFPAFKHHFEHHILSLRKVLQDDIDNVKRMKAVLMEKMKVKGQLAPAEVNTWIKLSTHHVHLASKVKSIPTPRVEALTPYVFD